MNNNKIKNVLNMCRYLSPLTISVRPSVFSKKYGPIMRSHIFAHRFDDANSSWSISARALSILNCVKYDNKTI